MEAEAFDHLVINSDPCPSREHSEAILTASKSTYEESAWGGGNELKRRENPTNVTTFPNKYKYV